VCRRAAPADWHQRRASRRLASHDRTLAAPGGTDPGDSLVNNAEEGQTCNLRLEVRAGAFVAWPETGPRPDDVWFDPEALAAAGHTGAGGTAGRGATVLFEADGRRLVLRHYRRGGLVRHLSDDLYLRTGLRNSRPWRELALLTRLHAGGMPVPPPVAARVSPVSGFSPWYRGDLVTEYLPGTRTLAEALREGPLDDDAWPRIGMTIAGFHGLAVDHADLNAHNVLLDGDGVVYLIDFDRARVRLRPRGRWSHGNLGRLYHSLNKLQRTEPYFAFSEGEWQRLLAGYRSTG
jgi:3-deoxy-D-manno-octulosonic acid kinase